MNEMGRCVRNRYEWNAAPPLGPKDSPAEATGWEEGNQKPEERRTNRGRLSHRSDGYNQIVTRGKEGREGRERHAGQKKGRVRVTPWPRKSLLRWPSGTQQGKPKREARWHDQSVGSLTGVQRTKDSAARSNRRMVAPRGTETGSPLVGRWGSPAAEAPPGSPNRWCWGCGCGGSRGG